MKEYCRAFSNRIEQSSFILGVKLSIPISSTCDTNKYKPNFLVTVSSLNLNDY